MINLLPHESKKEIRAGRANTILARYTGVVLAAFGFLALILIGSHLLLSQTKLSAESLIESNDPDASEYANTQQEITQLTDKLGTARGLLDSRVSYLGIVRSIAEQMPDGVVIGSIELNPEAVSGSPIALTVFARTTEGPVSLDTALSSSSRFSNISISSVRQNDGIDGYPVSASLSMTINGVPLR